MRPLLLFSPSLTPAAFLTDVASINGSHYMRKQGRPQVSRPPGRRLCLNDGG